MGLDEQWIRLIPPLPLLCVLDALDLYPRPILGDAPPTHGVERGVNYLD